MSEDKMYTAMREFIREAVGHEVLKATQPLNEQIRSLRTALETRSAPTVIEGPAGKDGKDGANGVDGKNGRDGKDGLSERGADGVNGKDGKDGANGRDGAPSTVPGPKGDAGERGADGISTRAELESIVETRFAELQVRSFADSYREVYKPGDSYKRGEFVTWDGSTWLAMRDTSTAPMASQDWKLFVKKGRDGRDRK